MPGYGSMTGTLTSILSLDRERRVNNKGSRWGGYSLVDTSPSPLRRERAG